MTKVGKKGCIHQRSDALCCHVHFVTCKNSKEPEGGRHFRQQKCKVKINIIVAFEL